MAGMNFQTRSRYGNDLELAYSVLKGVGNFSDINIALLFGDGLSQLSVGQVRVQAARKEIWEEYIKFQELAWHLNRIAAKKIIVLGECFAGDFLQYNIKKSCVFTANSNGKVSYAHVKTIHDLQKENFIFDEFLYHFFSFLQGKYPDTGNRIPEGDNNLNAAYEYAKANDIFNPANKKRERIAGMIDKDIVEIPQMKNNLTFAELRL